VIPWRWLFNRFVRKGAAQMDRNLNTTLWGVGAILVAVGNALVALFDGNPASGFDIGPTLAAILAGVGLINAKDAE